MAGLSHSLPDQSNEVPRKIPSGGDLTRANIEYYNSIDCGICGAYAYHSKSVIKYCPRDWEISENCDTIQIAIFVANVPCEVINYR